MGGMRKGNRDKRRDGGWNGVEVKVEVVGRSMEMSVVEIEKC